LLNLSFALLCLGFVLGKPLLQHLDVLAHELTVLDAVGLLVCSEALLGLQLLHFFSVELLPLGGLRRQFLSGMLPHHEQVFFLLQGVHLALNLVDLHLNLLRLSVRKVSLALHVLDATLDVLHLLSVLSL
jgi:hypothetical protein